MGHVRKEFRLVFGREGELTGFFLQCFFRKFDFSILALDFHVLVGEQAGLFLKHLIGLLKLKLPCLKLFGQRLRLLE